MTTVEREQYEMQIQNLVSQINNMSRIIQEQNTSMVSSPEHSDLLSRESPRRLRSPGKPPLGSDLASKLATVAEEDVSKSGQDVKQSQQTSKVTVSPLPLD